MWLILVIIAYIIDLSYGQSCSAFSSSVSCETSSACTWVGGTGGSGGQCNCASEVKLDILFGVDTSGSIGLSGFQVQKQFVSNLVARGIGNESRIGFYMFNTYVNETRSIQFWDKADLNQFVNGMWWTGGWTNTMQLTANALEHFAATFDPTRQQIFIILTDGNPCLPQSQGGCPQSACQFRTQVFQAGIRVVVIGVGDGLNSAYVKCLTQSDSDWIPVSTFSDEAFESILGSLSEVLCPVSKEFKVTEVKALKKQNNGLTARLGRFVEIYNSGIDFNISDISITGLITMDQDNSITAKVLQSQYAVFYDASDPPLLSTSGYEGSTPTCQLCEWDQTNNNLPCDLSNCAGAGLDGDTFAGTCFCANSIYIACGNANNGAGNCNSNAAMLNNAQGNVYNGCGQCTFVNSGTMGKTNWDISFWDAYGNNLIDAVDYGATGTGSWIVPLDGYSLELAWKGFDNDYGSSWIQSCSQFGTPGSDPYAQCDETCVTLGSDCGGTNTCDPSTGNCLCDATTGYYPSCQAPGVGCFQCAEVPQIEECVVVWRKNGTDKYAYYNWTVDAPASNGGFFLQYFAAGEAGNCGTGQIGGGADAPCDVTIKNVGQFNKDDAIYTPFQRIDSYYADNYTIGGYVYAFEAVCDTTSVNTATSCTYYVSDAIPCIVITPSPTLAPTNPPSRPPVPPPTYSPTPSPTFACPRYWIDDDEVCKDTDDNGWAGDRCYCNGKSKYGNTESCCLLDYDFDVKYDEPRTHATKDECLLDAQLENPQCRYNSDCDAGSSEGYLLSEGAHAFDVAISPEAQPCTFDVCWKLVFTETDCNYGSRRRLANGTSSISDGSIECDEDSTNLAAAGLAVDVTSGCLRIWKQNTAKPWDERDEKNATIEFTVTRLNCEEAEAALNTRRRLQDTSCFDSIAIKGELMLVNATSVCQPDCDDGRVYPFRIPVWYNYQAAYVAPPAGEKELPAWLWWLIAALVVFLALLALLVYKYWWKNKATGAALGATQADLDAAVMENEQGFGGDLGNGQVGFNPLATGFNPNAPAGVAGPNAPPHSGGGQADFVRPNVQKIQFKQQFGPQAGNFR